MNENKRKLTKAEVKGHKVRIKKIRASNPELFKEAGSIGGNNSPTKYTSESGRLAANKRWEKWRAEQIKKRKESVNGQ